MRGRPMWAICAHQHVSVNAQVVQHAYPFMQLRMRQRAVHALRRWSVLVLQDIAATRYYSVLGYSRLNQPLQLGLVGTHQLIHLLTIVVACVGIV